jgi:hypothetical protein
MRDDILPEEVGKALTVMIPTPAPNPAHLVAHRQAFLANVRRLRNQQAVSVSPGLRLKKWIDFHFSRKESYTMLTLIRTALAVIAVLGVAGGTAYGADTSLPGQPLYPLDLGLEQVQMTFTPMGEQRAWFDLQITSERAEELIAMEQHGQTPDQASLTRLNAQVETTLRDLATLSPEQLSRLLEELRVMSQDKVSVMAQLGYGDGEQVMQRAQEQAQYGLDDPQGFQRKYRHGAGWQSEDTPVATPEPTELAAPAPTLPVTPTQNQQRDQDRDRDGSCQSGTGTCEPDQDQTRQQDRDQAQAGDGSGPQWAATPDATQPDGSQGGDSGGGQNGGGQNGNGQNGKGPGR